LTLRRGHNIVPAERGRWESPDFGGSASRTARFPKSGVRGLRSQLGTCWPVPDTSQLNRILTNPTTAHASGEKQAHGLSDGADCHFNRNEATLPVRLAVDLRQAWVSAQLLLLSSTYRDEPTEASHSCGERLEPIGTILPGPISTRLRRRYARMRWSWARRAVMRNRDLRVGMSQLGTRNGESLTQIKARFCHPLYKMPRLTVKTRISRASAHCRHCRSCH